MALNWPHFWYCVFVFHDGYTGCGDLVWVSDLYDYATGFLGLGSIAVCVSWMAIDEWRKGNREFGYATLTVCTLALIVLTAGFLLPTIE